MNLRPVIEREFRVASRLRSTYRNRSALGALLLVLGGVMLLLGPRVSALNNGELLFITFHTAVFCAIWVFVPLDVADVISREKRDDTLGLLLLTPLSAAEVAAAKWLSAFLRSLPLFLATLPFFVLPLMLGGVSVWDVLRAFMIDLSALFGAVTAGLVASSLCERRGRAWLLVLFFASLMWVIIYTLHAVLLIILASDLSGGRVSGIDLFGHALETPEFLLFFDFVLATGSMGSLWHSGAEFDSTGMVVMLSILTVGFAVLLAGSGIRFSGRRIERIAESKFLTPRQLKTRRTFTEERFFKGRLSKVHRRLMEKNPIAWYHQRLWSARLSKWGWLLAIAGMLAFFSTGNIARINIVEPGVWMIGFIVFSLLLTSSAALTQERSSGVLELLFSTLFGPKDYVHGRLISIWKSYLPSAVALSVILCGVPIITMGFPEDVEARAMLWTYVIGLPAVLIGVLIFLPMVGLYCSLMGRDFANSATVTFFLAVLVPWGIPLGLWFVGLGAYDLRHNSSSYAAYLPWVMSGIWLFSTAALQISVLLAARRGRLWRVWPTWLSRWKLTLILPWLLPLAAWGLMEWSGMERIRHDARIYFYLVAAWQLAALGLLIQTAYCARRELIRVLEQRSFPTPQSPEFAA